jgi:hypothetical protein
MIAFIFRNSVCNHIVLNVVCHLAEKISLIGKINNEFVFN